MRRLLLLLALAGCSSGPERYVRSLKFQDQAHCFWVGELKDNGCAFYEGESQQARASGWAEGACQDGTYTLKLTAEGARRSARWTYEAASAFPARWCVPVARYAFVDIVAVATPGQDRASVHYRSRWVPTEDGEVLLRHGLQLETGPTESTLELARYSGGWSPWQDPASIHHGGSFIR